MSKETVSDFVWKRLHAWGVRRVFGYPGDGVNGLLGGLQRFGTERIGFVQARHEEMAAFMAVAHAKFTGELGVCIATSGPGAAHLVTGLYDAKLDHMPVLAICGQQARTALGSHYQQELDLSAMLKDVASDYVMTASVASQVRHLVDRAVRIAVSRRCVTALIFPNDLQEEPMQAPAREHGAVFSGVGWSAPRVLPVQEDLEHAASVLNAGKRIALLVGAGAKDATDEIIAVADRLGAGCAKALLGKQVLPDDLPWVTGSIGLLGTQPSHEMMKQCDTLLMLGSGFPYAEFLPEEGKARGVQVDIDASMLSLRYPMECNLTGDVRETLQALLPLLEPREDMEWRRQIARWRGDWTDTLHKRAQEPARPVNPQRVFTELSPRLPDNVILTSDSGSCANWYARHLQMRRGMIGSLSGGLASMGAAVPYAIAAKFAHPGRPVIALVGDGAMQMNNMAELITIQKYWQQWSDPRLIVMVLNNEDLNQVTWEQRGMEGMPRFVETQALPDVPYHAFAKLLGLEGIFVDTPEGIAPAWERALASSRPVVLEMKTDPDVPPLPAEMTLAQARSFARSMAGEEEPAHVIGATLRQWLGKFGQRKQEPAIEKGNSHE